MGTKEDQRGSNKEEGEGKACLEEGDGLQYEEAGAEAGARVREESQRGWPADRNKRDSNILKNQPLDHIPVNHST